MANQQPTDIPLGFCHCGCGERTRLAPVNDRSKGWVKGHPLLFVKGHHTRFMSQAGAESHNWKGGKNVTGHGYVQIRMPDGTRQYEHIVVAEKALGRKLKSYGIGHPDNEVVHHVFGDKLKNTNNNLLICTHEYHIALHHRLEQSEAWPEFPPVVRNGFGGSVR